MPDFFWTPHSGYHGTRSRQRFFEGWYFRLILPSAGESFAFMYSIDDPAGQSELSGGAAQILGPGEQYLYCPFPDVRQFWAWSHCLGLGHWGGSQQAGARYVQPEDFFSTVSEGYQATATQHQGCVVDVSTGAIARWSYTVTPVYGWGNPNAPQLPTAGWLSYFPIFEPGWQVIMAHGWATGWANWQGQQYEFEQAPAYAEKNWGSAFPERWFWMQCNAFDAMPNLTVTAAGGLRQLLGSKETVGLVGIHVHDEFIGLSSLQAAMTWEVGSWGTWRLTGQDHRYRVLLQGKAEHPPAVVRVPTLTGLQFDCWDTAKGQLWVQVWRRQSHGDVLILDAASSLAGLEVGGQGWQQPWCYSN